MFLCDLVRESFFAVLCGLCCGLLFNCLMKSVANCFVNSVADVVVTFLVNAIDI